MSINGLYNNLKQNPDFSRGLRFTIEVKLWLKGWYFESEDVDAEDDIDKLDDGPSGKNNSQTDKSTGNLGAGRSDFLFVTFGSNPLNAAPDKHEEKEQGSDQHDQADQSGN